VNDCPYCGDMLISLVHAGGRHEAASNIFSESEAAIADGILRARLAWVKSVASAGTTKHPPTPFTAEELPEAITALMAMSDINRFSHVVMNGSPASAPFGLQGVKAAALRLFGDEFKSNPCQTAHSRTSSVVVARRLTTYGYAVGNSKSTYRRCARALDSSR